VTFTETPLEGAYVVEIERINDERGWFARSFCSEEFEEHGLDPSVVQCNLSFNYTRGTLRGMHYQEEPHAECKLVRCVRGAIYDVVVDLRADSPTYRTWYGVELTPENGRMLYVPKGLAHGFQTLADESEVFYQMSEVHVPSHARGVRWNDPAFGIRWPETEERIISAKDQAYPDFMP
jgi:dTDP-4-dehydrorhamnose 3,5-epimerase